MKKIIPALVLSMLASTAFAQAVSAPTMLPEGVVSSPSVDSQDVSAPYVAAMDCCAVSVSAPKVQAEDDSDSLAMAGLGFGLAGLVGVSKLARRKKQK